MKKNDLVIKAALELFAKQGVSNTSTAQITKKAGVAEGTLFMYFKNKQALVDAIYIEIKQREYEHFAEFIDTTKSTKENILSLSKEMANYFLKNNQELQFILHVHQLDLVSKLALKEVKESATELCKHMSAWQKEGQLKSLDITLLGAQMWSLVVATVLYCKEHKKKPTEKIVVPIWDALRTD